MTIIRTFLVSGYISKIKKMSLLAKLQYSVEKSTVGRVSYTNCDCSITKYKQKTPARLRIITGIRYILDVPFLTITKKAT